MELFDLFRDTIFLKEDSDLEKQLDELKRIREKLNSTDEIDKDIKLLEYGIAGEKEIAFELKNANILDKCSTAMGSRFLKKSILFPLVDLNQILLL